MDSKENQPQKNENKLILLLDGDSEKQEIWKFELLQHQNDEDEISFYQNRMINCVPKLLLPDPVYYNGKLIYTNVVLLID